MCENVKNLPNHVVSRRFHNETKPWKTFHCVQGLQCPKCEHVLHDRKSYLRHLRSIHGEEKTFQCPHCGKAKTTKTQLVAHVKQVHERVACDICSKMIPNEYDLKRHKVLVHQVMDGAWICKACPKKVFFSLDTFLKHEALCKN